MTHNSSDLLYEKGILANPHTAAHDLDCVDAPFGDEKTEVLLINFQKFAGL
jgi:hypothetical protein